MEPYLHSPPAQGTVALLQRTSPYVAIQLLSEPTDTCAKGLTADINSCCAQYCHSNANITVNYTLTECCVVVSASSHIHGRRGTLNSKELRQLACSIQTNINLNYVHCAVHTLPVSYNKKFNVRATLHCGAFALLLLP